MRPQQHRQQLSDIRTLVQGRIASLTNHRQGIADRAHKLAMEALVASSEKSIDAVGIADLEKKALLLHGEAAGITHALMHLDFIVSHGVVAHAYGDETKRLSRATKIGNIIDRPISDRPLTYGI